MIDLPSAHLSTAKYSGAFHLVADFLNKRKYIVLFSIEYLYSIFQILFDDLRRPDLSFDLC